MIAQLDGRDALGELPNRQRMEENHAPEDIPKQNGATLTVIVSQGSLGAVV